AASRQRSRELEARPLGRTAPYRRCGRPRAGAAGGRAGEREQSRPLLRDVAGPCSRRASRGKPGAQGAQGAQGARRPLTLVLLLCGASSPDSPGAAAPPAGEAAGRARQRGRGLVGASGARQAEDAAAPGSRPTGGAARARCSDARRVHRAGGRPTARPPGLQPGRPRAACGALQAAGPRDQQRAMGETRPPRTCWRAFPGVPGARGRIQMPPSPVPQLQDHLQGPGEELSLTAICPQRRLWDPGKGSRACDGLVHTPAEPLEPPDEGWAPGPPAL
ncbi:uncharacterized protein C2orf72-like, partial [Canis lupus familiaris]|uniref:uncharacterized protein C2orf72-like n=1 Tax=Canis lupus familiaris TaxID=9615 RepID=UPI0018F74FC7